MCCVALQVCMAHAHLAAADEFQDSYDQAIAAYKARRFAEALTLFEQANRLAPKLRLLVNQGQALLELGRPAEARERCEAFLQRASPDSSYRAEAEACVRRAQTRPPVEAVESAARRAEEAFAQQRYGEARRAWRLAYEEHPQAIYLYHCGEASQLLQEWEQAISDFRAYLTVEGNTLPPESAAELQQRITGLAQVLERQQQELQRRLTPPSAPARQRLERVTEVRRNEGVLAAGLTLWLSAYLPALGLGAWYGSLASSRPETFYVLAAPVAGPFISAALYSFNSRGTQSATLSWSLPWALADGGAQLAGLIMTIVGSRRRAVPVHLASAIQLTPLASPLSVGLSAQGRF